jgi:aminopeptidase N
MAQTLHAAGHVPDPAAIHAARRKMHAALAKALGSNLKSLMASLQNPGPFTPDARDAGRRALQLAAMGLQSRLDDGKAARAAFGLANNMTDQTGALACLLDNGQGQAELTQFAAQWGHDRLVMDKWFAMQIGYSDPAQTAAIAKSLTKHTDFDWKNPNRFRSVIGALTGHHAGFHHASGQGYRLLADCLLTLDPMNPQTAARMSTAFDTWGRYDADRQGMIRAELSRILATEGLSRDLTEMTTRMLSAAE